ncbi:MAG TPA: putative peptidoglycan glycosyltransferase FtsW [Candidatus Dojkabacteria bacterium]|jgi:cell division protein FtsW
MRKRPERAKRRQGKAAQRSSSGPVGKGDRLLFGIVLGLVIFGTIMIFSGSVPIASVQELPPYYYFLRQLIFVVIGIVVFIFTYNFNYKNYSKIIIPAIAFTGLLLIIVLFTPKINETHRWLDLGFTTLQVSDVAKLTLTIYLASWLSKPTQKNPTRNAIENYIFYNLLPFLLILGVFLVLIIIQPDLSTTMLIAVIAITIYYLSGRDLLHNIGTAGIFITMAISGVIAGIIAPYRFQRITSFLDFLKTGVLSEPFGRDYQLRQVLIAVATGNLFGEGFAQSKQKFSYLTETAFSDTIFAIFAEEFGFFGSVVLISIYIFIMSRGFRIAATANDRFGSLLATGITIWITVQAFIHIAVNVGLIPLTGMPLPFISYGGSSLVVSMAAIGILINISRYSSDFKE